MFGLTKYIKVVWARLGSLLLLLWPRCGLCIFLLLESEKGSGKQ